MFLRRLQERVWLRFLGGALALSALSLSGCSHAPEHRSKAPWNPKAAAAYLDAREVTWMAWPSAARDHGTFCVSCHTVLPYTLSRPVLRTSLAQPGLSDEERKIIEDVTHRVRFWNEVGPYYTDENYGNGKPAESRGTEAVLNALVLVSYESPTGKLSDDARAALHNMWALQQTEGAGRGAWPWLRFGMEPFEADDSQYYGAALAAITTGIAPESYRTSPDIQTNIKLLTDYLHQNLSEQSLMNRVVALWASSKMPGLLDADQRRSILDDIRGRQRSDGGWNLASDAWPADRSVHSFVRRRLRSDWSRQESSSDGYATGLIAFVLEDAGTPPTDETLQKGLAWLVANQNADGSWTSLSLTKRRDPLSNAGNFMRDAATAYAVLALCERDAHSGTTAASLVPKK